MSAAGERSRLALFRSKGGAAWGAGRRRLEEALGGKDRTRVIVVLAAILALSSADTSTVGASAVELRKALHIGDTEIGLLVSVSAAVGALASLPFGVLVDKVKRVRLLTITIGVWGIAMVASATVSDFGSLLLVRLLLGFTTAVAGPAVGSLVGDYFAAGERGRIYGYILTGELLGGGVGFFITGDIAAISWRAAFVILALPAFVLAWHTAHLKEPPRGGDAPLSFLPDEETENAGAHFRRDRDGGPGELAGGMTHAQQTARDRGIQPNPDLVLTTDPRKMGIVSAVRYVMSVRTNIILVVSSACSYFFLTGIQTFGLEFVGKQYRVDTVLASALMLVVGTGAVLGVLLGGRAGDALVQRGRINGQMLVAGVSAMATVVLFLPPLLTHSTTTALPYIVFAAFFLTAQNPTLDAARLEIMPPLLWGRAEGIRTLLRSAAQAIAPVTFGGLSDLLSGTHQGMRFTFMVMLIPLAASGVVLLRGLRRYPVDVATAAASAASTDT